MNWKNFASLMIIFLFPFSVSSYSWTLPLNIDVCEINFNYTSGDTEDGIPIASNYGTTVQPPEWTTGGQTSNSFAYLRSTSYAGPKVKVKFYCRQGDITSATIFAYPCDELFWNFSNTGEVTFSSGYSQYCYFQTPQGVLPNTVGIIYAYWAWRVSKVNGETQSPTILTDDTLNKGYVVLSSPIFAQDCPWVEVLDKACSWASGTSTEDGCRNAIVGGLYNYGTYNSISSSSNFSGGLGLTNLILNFQNGERDMDCKDFSNFANILLYSQGIASQYSFYDAPFTTHCILSAGTSFWGAKSYTNHQISVYNSTQAIDATGMIDLDSDPDSYPWSAKLPSGDVDVSPTFLNKLTSNSSVSFLPAQGNSSIY